MEIDWLGASLALPTGMGVAFLWYQRGPLADAWERLTGVTPDRSRPARTRNMVQLTLAVGLTALGLAAAIPIAAAATGNRSVGLALLVGLTAWLAFSGSTLLQHNAFELKPAPLTALNAGYQLVLLLAMSLVIGVV